MLGQGAGARGNKKRPQPEVRAIATDDAPVSDWASLFGDLARPIPHGELDTNPVEWRIHDKTHIEFAIDYPKGASNAAHVWEAYFFVPESFRLHETTYTKKALYDDLQSYVRFAVPELPFRELAKDDDGSCLHELKLALEGATNSVDNDSEAAKEAMRAVRLVACLVRASGLVAMREIEAEVARETADIARVRSLVFAFIVTCGSFARALRCTLKAAEAKGLPENVVVAMHWADEDISLAIEALCADLAVKLEQHAQIDLALPDLAERVASRAVEEARHRLDVGYNSVGSATATSREVEHLEFRRHVLKRFTSSVLWLSLEVRDAAAWVLHAFYGVAAGLAMALAFVASFGTSSFSDHFFRYAMLVAVSYAIKDRTKAFLQTAASKWIEKRYPDRLWTLRDRERRKDVGTARERAGFVAFRKLPTDVLEMRRLTREHLVEEQARPERVIWHQKEVTLAKDEAKETSARFPMLTEIFRLNVAHWLSHTDDPNRKVVFADPTDASIYSATARRVYNINVVYRLRREGGQGDWHRIRVVVSRKGIERIDAIR